jgi:hypothetical protein
MPSQFRSVSWLSIRIGVAVLLTYAMPIICFAQEQMIYPVDVASNGSEFFIADRDLPGVWKFSDGKLNKLAAGTKKFRTPLNATRCVALDREGKVLVGDSATREVYRLGDDGTPTALTGGQIGIPMSIETTADGHLLVSDLELHRIYKVPGGGGKPELFGDLRAPRGSFLDAKDQLWVVGGDKEQLVRFAADGTKTVIIGERKLQYPSSCVVNDAGVAFVCDSYSKAIFRVEEGKEPVEFAKGEFVHPVGLAMVGDKIWVADSRAVAIFEVTLDGKISKLFPTP